MELNDELMNFPVCPFLEMEKKLRAIDLKHIHESFKNTPKPMEYSADSDTIKDVMESIKHNKAMVEYYETRKKWHLTRLQELETKLSGYTMTNTQQK